MIKKRNCKNFKITNLTF